MFQSWNITLILNVTDVHEHAGAAVYSVVVECSGHMTIQSKVYQTTALYLLTLITYLPAGSNRAYSASERASLLTGQLWSLCRWCAAGTYPCSPRSLWAWEAPVEETPSTCDWLDRLLAEQTAPIWDFIRSTGLLYTGRLCELSVEEKKDWLCSDFGIDTGPEEINSYRLPMRRMSYSPF